MSGVSPTHSHIKQRFSRKKLMLRFCDGHLRLRFVGPLGASGSESLRIGERGAPLFDSRGFYPFAVRTQTAEDCRCYNAPLCVPAPPCEPLFLTAFAPLFAALGLGVGIC